MKISDLSKRSGVSIATIKYYLREGLLASGESTASNQADYGDAHVRRLRLIRALIDVGEIPVASVRSVLHAVDSSSISLHDAFGEVMHSLGGAPPQAETGETGETGVTGPVATSEVQAWLKRRRWSIKPNAPAPHALAAMVDTLRAFDFPVSVSDFDAAADAAEQSAELEVAYARAMADRTAAVETMVIGTIVYERALAEVRRLALEAVSARLENTATAGPRRRSRVVTTAR